MPMRSHQRAQAAEPAGSTRPRSSTCTSRTPRSGSAAKRGMYPDCTCCPQTFEPRAILEIRTAIAGSRSSSRSTHPGDARLVAQLDTLVAALCLFREALVAEFERYDRRHGERRALRA